MAGVHGAAIHPINPERFFFSLLEKDCEIRTARNRLVCRAAQVGGIMEDTSMRTYKCHYILLTDRSTLRFGIISRFTEWVDTCMAYTHVRYNRSDWLGLGR